ncbi:MAG TPA: 2-oxoacid:acceptor oxidoreductase family protein, partial [Bacteroidales bacterium]|nr:2-oxoacid:acceptor oxidoreductase family protein [Bacteroidales bacterium]
LLYDPHGITRAPVRKDIQIHTIDATEIASDMDNSKAFNMIVLGAYLKVLPIVQLKSILEGLRKTLPARHHKLIPMNERALQAGMDRVK